MSQAQKAQQDAVIASQLGAEVLLQCPLVGEHRGSGQAEVAVREVRKQCRTLSIGAGMQVGKRIPDDHPLLWWLPTIRRLGDFQEGSWSRWKDSRSMKTITKMAKTSCTIQRQGVVPQSWRRRKQHTRVKNDSRSVCWSP